MSELGQSFAIASVSIFTVSGTVSSYIINAEILEQRSRNGGRCGNVVGVALADRIRFATFHCTALQHCDRVRHKAAGINVVEVDIYLPSKSPGFYNFGPVLDQTPSYACCKLSHCSIPTHRCRARPSSTDNAGHSTVSITVPSSSQY
jgi:hypothetical protein